jgi:hypothetical protein
VAAKSKRSPGSNPSFNAVDKGGRLALELDGIQSPAEISRSRSMRRHGVWVVFLLAV